MKTVTHATVCGLAVVLGLATPVHADPPKSQRKKADLIAADTVIARPAWLAATVVGSVLFVVTLPVAALSKSVDSSREALVTSPARATFKRPLGDFTTTDDWDW